MSSDKLNIGVFTYNFPHHKTQEGMLNLILNNYKPTVIFAQNFEKLNHSQSIIRTSPKYINLMQPKDIASYFKIPFFQVLHNSQETTSLIKKYHLDLGIILGARILKKDLINSFSIGILNLHHGIIPQNRGLDTLKWAIIDKIPQGITSHLIDEKIDLGKIIDIKVVDVFPDDTLIDISIRNQETLQKMMIESIKKMEGALSFQKIQGEGKYHSSMDTQTEALLLNCFDYYKQNYVSIKSYYVESNY